MELLFIIGGTLATLALGIDCTVSRIRIEEQYKEERYKLDKQSRHWY